MTTVHQLQLTPHCEYCLWAGCVWVDSLTVSIISVGGFETSKNVRKFILGQKPALINILHKDARFILQPCRHIIDHRTYTNLKCIQKEETIIIDLLDRLIDDDRTCDEFLKLLKEETFTIWNQGTIMHYALRVNRPYTLSSSYELDWVFCWIGSVPIEKIVIGTKIVKDSNEKVNDLNLVLYISLSCIMCQA